MFAWPALTTCTPCAVLGSTCCPLPLPPLDVLPKHYPSRTRPSRRGLLVYLISSLNQEGTSCVSLVIYSMLPHAMGLVTTNCPPTSQACTMGSV